jgi:hypothetical protein
MKGQTEHAMKKFYQEWLASGKSKAEFADGRCLVRTTFYYRAKKFSMQEEGSSAGTGFHLLDPGSPLAQGRAVAHMLR